MDNTDKQYQLGSDSGLIQSTDSAEVHYYLLQMLRQARDTVRISSPYLAPALLDREDIRSALSALARHSRYTEVRMLVSACRAVADRGHKLLELSRRLSSSAPIRELGLNEGEVHAEFILVDNSGVIELPASEQDPTRIHFGSRARNKTLTEHFDYLWQRSRIPAEFRNLIV